MDENQTKQIKMKHIFISLPIRELDCGCDDPEAVK
jgi:hypothetical protein